MNDEIKEILDMFTKYKDDWYSCEYKLKPKQCVTLYDYITNLQREIGKLNEDKRGILVELYKLNDTKDKIQDEYEKIIFEYLAENCGEFEDEHMEHLVDLKVQQYINLQQENERLKELVDADNESYDIQETIINRQKNELLEQEDYKTRCEKASNKLKRDYYTNYSQHNDDVVREALNILQNGSEKVD